MIGVAVGFGEFVAFSLLRHYMQHDGPAHFLQLPHDLDKLRQIVTVHRPVVLESELLKDHGGHHQVLKTLFHASHNAAGAATD